MADEDAEITGSDAATVRSPDDLARLLRQLRRRDARRRGDSPLTYRELAAKTGWSHSSIGLYFNGQALAPTDRFDVLVQLLGASPAEQAVLATMRDRVEERRFAGGVGERNAMARPGGPVTVPHALPAPVPHFIGRSTELRALDGLLQKGSTAGGTVVISAIGGTAGVGKTALAMYWAHRVAARFPDGQLYVNLRGFGPAEQVMDPAEAVRCFLDGLRVPPEKMPATLDGRTALFRSLLSGKRMLVVLDNARDTGQLRPLLPGTPGCLVLVTSRNLLSGLVATDGALPVTLDLLTEEEAWEFLVQRLGNERVTAEPVAVKEIITHCARLPLALAVVAARVAASPRIRLAAFATELRDTHRRWVTLTGDDPATDVRAVFSWSYHTLTTAAARLFRLMGLHPGPDLSPVSAASLCGTTETQARQLLAELADAHLVVEQASGRYTQHDLLRAYAAEVVRDDLAGERHEATRRMIDHYLHTAYAASRLLNTHGDPIPLDPPAPGAIAERFDGRGEAIEWLDAERSVLLAAVSRAAAAGFDAHAWRLAAAIALHLDRQGRWQDWISVAHTGLAAAVRAGDEGAQAQAHRFLARTNTRLNRLDEARGHLHRALELCRRQGDAVRQAHTYLQLSDLAAQQDDYAEAHSHARQALDLYVEAGHVEGQTDALNSVGWYLAQLGEYEKAIGYCEQSLALHQQLGPGIVEATTWDSLGYAYHHLGNHDYAISCYRRAVDLFHELGARSDRAESMVRLGDAEEAAGKLDAAIETWQRTLEMFELLDDQHGADRVGAKLHAARGRPGRSSPDAAAG
ncbi:MAG TPA: tetratricopeptide repeat protein [Candidatus Limnocylindrales bacterium]